MSGIIEQGIFSLARFLRVKGSKRTIKTGKKKDTCMRNLLEKYRF